MAGSGSPTLPTLDGSGLRVAIIAASWHTQVMDGLIAGAEKGLASAGVRAVTLIRVPGTFELPVAAARLAQPAIETVNNVDDFASFLTSAAGGMAMTRPQFDAIVALGVVIRGGTPHFEYVCEAATMGLTEVSVKSGIPIGFGVLTCDDEAQALDRAGGPGASEDKGFEAAQAAVATALTLRDLEAQQTRQIGFGGRNM